MESISRFLKVDKLPGSRCCRGNCNLDPEAFGRAPRASEQGQNEAGSEAKASLSMISAYVRHIRTAATPLGGFERARSFKLQSRCKSSVLSVLFDMCMSRGYCKSLRGQGGWTRAQ